MILRNLTIYIETLLQPYNHTLHERMSLLLNLDTKLEILLNKKRFPLSHSTVMECRQGVLTPLDPGQVTFWTSI